MVMRELRRNYSYRGVVYEAHIAYRRRSGIRLSIKRDGSLSISVPTRISLADLDAQVAKMMPWVEKHRRVMDQEKACPFTYILGERVPTEDNEESIRKGYAKEALAYFSSRVAYYAPIMGIKTPYKVAVRDMDSRVGSNSSRTHTLAFSLWLYHFPPEVIDSVVIHELAHDQVKNHSGKFYAIVLKYCPDYWRLRKKIVRHDYGKDQQ